MVISMMENVRRKPSDKKEGCKSGGYFVIGRRNAKFMTTHFQDVDAF